MGYLDDFRNTWKPPEWIALEMETLYSALTNFRSCDRVRPSVLLAENPGSLTENEKRARDDFQKINRIFNNLNASSEDNEQLPPIEDGITHEDVCRICFVADTSIGNEVCYIENIIEYLIDIDFKYFPKDTLPRLHCLVFGITSKNDLISDVGWIDTKYGDRRLALNPISVGIQQSNDSGAENVSIDDAVTRLIQSVQPNKKDKWVFVLALGESKIDSLPDKLIKLSPAMVILKPDDADVPSVNSGVVYNISSIDKTINWLIDKIGIDSDKKKSVSIPIESDIFDEALLYTKDSEFNPVSEKIKHTAREKQKKADKSRCS